MPCRFTLGTFFQIAEKGANFEDVCLQSCTRSAVCPTTITAAAYRPGPFAEATTDWTENANHALDAQQRRILRDEGFARRSLPLKSLDRSGGRML
jgi:hypothetical protein